MCTGWVKLQKLVFARVHVERRPTHLEEHVLQLAGAVSIQTMSVQGAEAGAVGGCIRGLHILHALHHHLPARLAGKVGRGALALLARGTRISAGRCTLIQREVRGSICHVSLAHAECAQRGAHAGAEVCMGQEGKRGLKLRLLLLQRAARRGRYGAGQDLDGAVGPQQLRTLQAGACMCRLP